MSDTPVLVNTNATGLLSDKSFNGKYPYRKATGAVDAFSSNSIIHLVVNASQTEMHLQKHQVIASTKYGTPEILHIKSVEPSAYPPAP